MRRHRKSAVAAAVAALAGMALAPAAQAASGTGGQVITGSVLSVITVTPAPVTLTGMSPGSSTPASGSGLVAVTSTDCYSLSVSDAANDGYLKSGLNAFTSRLQWRNGTTGTFVDLLTAPATAAANRPVTLGATYTMNYQQPQADQNVPAGAYTTTATFTGTTSSC